jgi:hypothetical protein
MNDSGPAPFHVSEFDPFDVATRQLLPYFNGFYHIAKISELAAVDISIVRSVVRNLAFYGLVTLLPVFLYSNRYQLTAKIMQLYEDSAAQTEAVQFVRLSDTVGGLSSTTAQRECQAEQHPNISDVLSLYCSFEPHMSVKDWFLRFQPRQVMVDERRLVQYGVWKGYLRKITGYLVSLEKEPSCVAAAIGNAARAARKARKTTSSGGTAVGVSVASSSRGADNNPNAVGRKSTVSGSSGGLGATWALDGSESVAELAMRENVTPEMLIRRVEGAHDSGITIIWK